MRKTTLDEKDTAILAERQAAILAESRIKQGDFIRFNDGVVMVVAHVWRDKNDNPKSIQPARGGSLYLGNGYMEFSGSPESGIDYSHFRATDETISGECWFFHHNYATAGGGIEVTASRHVWECDTESPEDYSKVYNMTQITQEYHDRTCNYWFLVYLGSSNHTAFTTAEQLTAWMEKNNLELTMPLVKVGEYQNQRLAKNESK